ncbi:MAG TPA: response regulator [Jatrophihabitans sp.]|nr:response regulator [Jatrophihabitans sp.]
MRLIVADDSAVMRKIVIRTLRQTGLSNLDIIEAGDGQELVQLVQQHDPDLVLSDWNMPNLTGIEALAQLRSMGLTVPFGFVTSEGSDMMRERAQAAGALFLLAKPFTPESMEDALSAVV